MFGRSSWCLLILLSSLVAAVPLHGQAAPVNPERRGLPEFVEQLMHSADSPSAPVTHPVRIPVAGQVPGFPQLVRAAGMIFSGTVLKIERRPPKTGQTVETVAITFHVENSIRGVTAGRNLTISQWVGVWSSGQRYRIGERVLLFLYPRSKLGLTSTVGGAMGRLPVDQWGRVLLSAQHLSAFRTDPVLGGRSHVSVSDFALAVRQANEEE
jgi:hypothetical protein